MTIPPLGPVVEVFKWWVQYEECEYRTFPPAVECDDYGPIRITHSWRGEDRPSP